MVVPRAPRIVAFERNTRVIQAHEAHSDLISQSPISAAVIPAAMRTASSASFKKISPSLAARVTRPLLERRRATPQAIAARWDSKSEPNLVDTMTAGTNQIVPSVSETLLIIQTTRRVGPNSWAWSVGVWRVTLVNATREGAGRGPVAGRT